MSLGPPLSQQRTSEPCVWLLLPLEPFRPLLLLPPHRGRGQAVALPLGLWSVWVLGHPLPPLPESYLAWLLAMELNGGTTEHSRLQNLSYRPPKATLQWPQGPESLVALGQQQ